MKEQCDRWRMRRRIKKRKGRQTGMDKKTENECVSANTTERRRINLGQTEQDGLRQKVLTQQIRQ